MPARSLIIERAVFPATLTSDTRVAVFSKISSCPKEDTSVLKVATARFPDESCGTIIVNEIENCVYDIAMFFGCPARGEKNGIKS
jgi:hypothetical protein